MKANFEFSLPEENEEYLIYSKANKYASAIWDYNQALRNILKYESEKYDDKVLEGLDRARQIFYDTLEDHGLEEL